MACINPDGTLTEVAARVLSALLERRAGTEGLAAATGLPLYRVRGTVRETGAAGLIEEGSEGWRLTDKGREVLELSLEDVAP